MRLLPIILSVIALAVPGAQADERIFDVGGHPAQRAIVASTDRDPSQFLTGSGMLLQITGAMAAYEGGQLAALRRCEPPKPGFIGRPEDAQQLCIIYLFRGNLTKRIEVIRTVDRVIIAEELDATEDPPPRVELRREPFEELMTAWPIYKGGFELRPVPLASVSVLEKPYIPGAFAMTEKTLRDRFFHGRRANVQASDRNLADETLRLRLPREYDVKRPVGLLVWIDPRPEGLNPEEVFEACDALGLVCISAQDSGNNRHVSNRYQLALDGVATAMSRYHIDPRHVYVSGMSGGGRVSSNLAACFPDIFTGSIPIVGLSCYKPVPNGVGGYWTNGYLRPASSLFRLFKTRPMAAISGKKDYNLLEMTRAKDVMSADGVDIRLFIHEKMGHHMPTPGQFLEAIKWVDYPYTQLRAQEAESAEQLLQRTVSRFGDQISSSRAARKLLVEVTQVGPWTDAAWEAVELLNQIDEGN